MSAASTPVKAVLFDRDGTLVHDVPYSGHQVSTICIMPSFSQIVRYAAPYQPADTQADRIGCEQHYHQFEPHRHVSALPADRWGRC